MSGTHAVYGRWMLASAGTGTPEVRTDAYVIVEEGLITEVTSERPRGLPVYEIPDAFVLPGFVNCHNHCSSALLTRG